MNKKFTLKPFIEFQGQAEEAVNFYKSIFGGKLKLLHRYKDNKDQLPEAMKDAKLSEKIIFFDYENELFGLLGCDAMFDLHDYKGISLSLDLTDESKAKKFFNDLSVGGKVKMPLEKQYFSSLFGIVVDKYSIEWLINID